ncbi:MAG: hypothetical protein RLZZ618_94 [Pseudomonadota bacterium]|jgi:hypothetical protein
MSAPVTPAVASSDMLPAAQQPFFHADSGTVRFWVPVNGSWMGATISRETLHYRFRPEAQGEDPLETYKAFSADIHAAVLRRVAGGSLEPVMLREYDLRAGA